MTRNVGFLVICSAVAAAEPSAGRPVHARGKNNVEALLQAEAPYIAKGRATYPAAKKRYLARLPRGYIFLVRYRLRAPGTHRSEGVFVEVNAIKGDKIYGRIASEVDVVRSFRPWQHVSFPESEIEDWSILHPDGSEEGNFVGKFLERLQRR